MFNLEKKIQRNMISSAFIFIIDTTLPPAGHLLGLQSDIGCEVKV